jgi:hypothetical protein
MSGISTYETDAASKAVVPQWRAGAAMCDRGFAPAAPLVWLWAEVIPFAQSVTQLP